MEPVSSAASAAELYRVVATARISNSGNDISAGTCETNAQPWAVPRSNDPDTDGPCHVTSWFDYLGTRTLAVVRDLWHLDRGRMTRADDVRAVLQALSDPVRLEMVRRLAAADVDLTCAELYEDLPKSTASYHFASLRRCALIEQYDRAGRRMNRLRYNEIEVLAPGLLGTVLASTEPPRTASASRRTPRRGGHEPPVLGR